MRNGFIAAVILAAGLLAFGNAGRAATLEAEVDIPTQTMTVRHQGEVIYTWSVSTARQGYITPAGEFRPQRMHRMWYSRKYDLSPMPYAVFYDRGWAVHGTNAVSRLGQPASHGCVRLSTANAKLFYDLVRRIGPGNTRIIVRAEAASS